MGGNTATIDVSTLRVQWDSQMPMIDICTHWTISRDQLIGLRDKLELAKRHDRALRRKPPRYVGPDAEEERASRESLSLAPQIAARATAVQAMWTDDQWRDRACSGNRSYLLRWIQSTDLIGRFLRDDEAAG